MTTQQNTIKRRYFKILNNTIYKTFISDNSFIEIKKPIKYLIVNELNNNLFKEMGIKQIC